MKIGYIKTKKRQSTQKQSEILISVGCEKIYAEPSNNIDYTREKLSEVLKTITVGDTIAVTRLSVISTTIQNLLELLFDLEDKQVQLQAVEQQYISTDNQTLDDLLFYLSEFLEDVRYEKQAIGIYRAKQKGKRLGRKPKMNKRKILQAIEFKKYSTSTQVANRFGVGKSTLLRHIAKYRKAG